MKEGLTYISERTGQLRYSDNNKEEKWLNPLSEYIPLVKVKRGQPLSIATAEDIAESDSDEKLLKLEETFVVPTDTGRHSHSVGLALESSDGVTFTEEGEPQLPAKIHALNSGRFEFDVSYPSKAGYDEDISTTLKNEYFPEFLQDYRKNIGKTVYVKGFDRDIEKPEDAAGLLTTNPEEAYFAYHNVIIIGHVSDAILTSADEKTFTGTIEVALEGDDRGAVDSTQFEAIVGENVVIDDKTHCTTVFALGQDEDSKLHFKLGYSTLGPDTFPESGFIAIQRRDGATVFIYPGEVSESEIGWNFDDIQFVERARVAAGATGEEITKIGLHQKATKETVAEFSKALVAAFNEAIAKISYDESVPVLGKEDVNYAKITGFDVKENINKEEGTVAYEFTADEIGGSYDVYITNNLKSYFGPLLMLSKGSYYNKGTAILADIREANRQNVLGVYFGNKYGETLKRGEKALFLRTGLYKAPVDQFVPGTAYYLSSNGIIVDHPIDNYTSVVKVGVAQTKQTLICGIDNARVYQRGDLPIGYMKPSVNGQAEFGFALMDGKTVLSKTDNKDLYDKLLFWYEEPDLKTNDDGWFKLPAVTYRRNGHEIPAQIKYAPDGIYAFEKIEPFIRHTFEAMPSEKVGNVEVAKISDTDVTSLLTFGPQADGTLPPEQELLDIRLYVNLPASDNNLTSDWIEVRPGFHVFNNEEYYGFEWQLVKTGESEPSNPFGKWVLRAITQVDEREELIGRGPCLLKSPYSPPKTISGLPYKLFIARRDYYPRQFDVEGLFDNYVKDAVLQPDGTPWKDVAVSGDAVANYIHNNVSTDTLEIGKPEKPGKIVANIGKAEINLTDTTLTGTAALKSEEGTTLNFEDGILQYPEEQVEEVAAKIDSIDGALTTTHNLKAHTEMNVDLFPNGEIHGLKFGGDGNIDAAKVAGAYVGSVGRIIAKNEGLLSKIPYILHHNERFITALGNEILFEELSFDGQKTVHLGQLNVLPNALRYRFGAEEKDTVHIEKKSDGLYFYDSTGKNLLNVYSKDNSSSARFKNIYKEFIDETINNIDAEEFYKEYNSNKTNVEDTDAAALEPTALQAISVLPLGLFKYKSQEAEDYAKKFFGIIIERVRETRDALQAEEFPTRKLKFLDETREGLQGTFAAYSKDYNFTEAQKKSMELYLKGMTNDNEQSVNVLSTVGTLLEATKELYNRTLLNEVSLYGDDSPTLPGAKKTLLDDKVPEYATPTPTHFGLNRLVKALCAEVFQVADPNELLAEFDPENSDKYFSKYSRVDQIDKEIYGSGVNTGVDGDAADKEIHIDTSKGATYPDKVTSFERAESYDVATTNIHENNNYLTDKESEQDFESKERSEELKAAIEAGEGLYNFDGINNTVNRIVAKLNRLTEEVNGSDNINNGPIPLDRLRDNIEVIIKELFYENYEDTGKDTDKSFNKKALSRIDSVARELFNYSIVQKENSNFADTAKDILIAANDCEKDETRNPKMVATPRKFNGKSVKGIPTESPSGAIEEIEAASPLTIDDYNYATIIDIIIDLISKDEKSLMRANNKEDKAIESKAEPHYAFEAADAESKVLDRCKDYRAQETLLDRISHIETTLDAISLRFSNIKNFDGTDTKWQDDDRENSKFVNEEKSEEIEALRAYKNITSIDDFMNWISGWTGIDVYSYKKTGDHKIGFVTGKDPSNTDTPAEKLMVQAAGTKIHEAVYDITSRVMAMELSDSTVADALGPTYNASIETKKTAKEIRKDKLTTAEGDSFYKNGYSVSSDLNALLTLIYGKNAASKENHFKDSSKKADDSGLLTDFNDSTNVLSPLYTKLYSLPKEGEKVNFDNGKITYLTDDILAMPAGERDTYLKAATTDRFLVCEAAIRGARKILGMNVDNESNWDSNFNANWTVTPEGTLIKNINGHGFNAKLAPKYEFDGKGFYALSTELGENEEKFNSANSLIELAAITYNELIRLSTYFTEFNEDIEKRLFEANERSIKQTGFDLNEHVDDIKGVGGVNENFETRIKEIETILGVGNDSLPIDSISEAVRELYAELYGDKVHEDGKFTKIDLKNFVEVSGNSLSGVPITGNDTVLVRLHNSIIQLHSRLTEIEGREMWQITQNKDDNFLTFTDQNGKAEEKHIYSVTQAENVIDSKIAASFDDKKSTRKSEVEDIIDANVRDAEEPKENETKDWKGNLIAGKFITNSSLSDSSKNIAREKDIVEHGRVVKTDTINSLITDMNSAGNSKETTFKKSFEDNVSQLARKATGGAQNDANVNAYFGDYRLRPSSHVKLYTRYVGQWWETDDLDAADKGERVWSSSAEKYRTANAQNVSYLLDTFFKDILYVENGNSSSDKELTWPSTPADGWAKDDNLTLSQKQAILDKKYVVGPYKYKGYFADNQSDFINTTSRFKDVLNKFFKNYSDKLMENLNNSNPAAEWKELAKNWTNKIQDIISSYVGSIYEAQLKNKVESTIVTETKTAFNSINTTDTTENIKTNSEAFNFGLAAHNKDRYDSYYSDINNETRAADNTTTADIINVQRDEAKSFRAMLTQFMKDYAKSERAIGAILASLGAAEIYKIFNDGKWYIGLSGGSIMDSDYSKMTYLGKTYVVFESIGNNPSRVGFNFDGEGEDHEPTTLTAIIRANGSDNEVEPLKIEVPSLETVEVVKPNEAQKIFVKITGEFSELKETK